MRKQELKKVWIAVNRNVFNEKIIDCVAPSLRYPYFNKYSRKYDVFEANTRYLPLSDHNVDPKKYLSRCYIRITDGTLETFQRMSIDAAIYRFNNDHQCSNRDRTICLVIFILYSIK